MNSSAHPVAPEQVMALMDGELSAELAQSVCSHISECAECQGINESLRATSKKLKGWPVETLERSEACYLRELNEKAAAKGMWESILLRFLGLRSPRRNWLPALAVIISVFAFVGLGSFRNLVQKRATTESQIQTRQSGVPSTDWSFVRVQPERAMLYAPPSVPPPPASAKTIQQAVAGQSTPMIARAVSLSIVVKEYDSSRASLDAILSRHKGYAAGLNVSTPQGAARTLRGSLRIPAPQLGAAVAELKALGRVEAETQNGEEVTQQHADLLARLKNSRETEQRLQDVLRTRTGKVKDVLEVEQEITRVREEIEQMEAEQQTLEHRVNFATIELKLAEEYKAQLTSPVPSIGMQLRNAIVNGSRSAAESVLGMILFFLESGPVFLLWIAIVFIPARVLWRRFARASAMWSSPGA
jgi:hypothetical protein